MIAKLLITVVASVLLVLHMSVVSSIAVAATEGSAHLTQMQGPKMQVAADATAALVVLLIAAVLSIYKPQGRIDENAPLWVRISGAILGLFVFAFILRHIAGGGMHSHL